MRDEIQNYFSHIHSQSKEEELMQDLHKRRTMAQVSI
jgi:hypothetical protein